MGLFSACGDEHTRYFVATHGTIQVTACEYGRFLLAGAWPIGTGALGLLVLGDAAPEILIANNMGNYADGIRGFSLITGVMLWGYGLR